MKTFKEFFVTEMAKKNKNKKSANQGEILATMGIGGEAANTLLRRKAGAHRTQKSKELSKQRKQGKDIAKRAMRGDY